MERKNYYEILGVSENATQDEISKVFKKLAKQYHPDRWVNASENEQKEAEEKFKEISEAYDILSNPDKRREYDNGGMPDLEEIFSQFGNPFGSMFGRHSHQRVNKGTNIQVNVDITLEEAYHGVDKKVNISRKEKCTSCNGTGSKDGKDSKCLHCNGTGMVTETYQMGPGSFSMSQKPCSHCKGTGKIIKNPCTACKGSGIVNKNTMDTISIPRGLSDGMAFAIQGAGNAPINGNGINGDLIVRVHIKEDKYFSRPDDLNLIHYDEVPFNECILGFSKEYKTIDGSTVTVNAPELTPHGKAFIFKGKGMQHPQNPNVMGDYAVVINYKLPNKLTKEQKEKLKDF